MGNMLSPSPHRYDTIIEGKLIFRILFIMARNWKVAVVLRASLDYLTGLENSYTIIQLPPMTDEQKNALSEFLRVFVKIPNL